MSLSITAQERALTFLEESSRLSGCEQNYHDEQLHKTGQGHYGAYLKAMEFGSKNKRLTVGGLEEWLSMLAEEDGRLGIQKDHSVYQLQDRESLVTLIRGINAFFSKVKNGRPPDIEVTKLMGKAFFSTKELNRRLVRLLIHYIAVRSDHPSIIFRKGEEDKIKDALGNETLACCYFADKIREALFVDDDIWQSEDESPSRNMHYRSPAEDDSILIQWNELDDAAWKWQQSVGATKA